MKTSDKNYEYQPTFMKSWSNTRSNEAYEETNIRSKGSKIAKGQQIKICPF